jgi:FkbM family methyltransferase
MPLRDEFFEVLRSLLAISRDHAGSRRRDLLCGFLRAQLLRIDPRKKRTPGEIRLLGYDVAFFRPDAVAILISEVLIHRAYYLDLPERPFIVDGGANIGLSVLLFKHLHPRCQILAFEPDPETFTLLQRNVQSNCLQDVELLNAALAGVPGEVELCFDPEVPGNLSMSTRPVANLSGRRRVRAVALSSYITRRVDLLKLDIEGAEVSVIQEIAEGGRLKLVDQIVMEYHHHVQPDEDRLGGLLSTLEENGFGYQIASRPPLPFRRGDACAMFLYAYRKEMIPG